MVANAIHRGAQLVLNAETAADLMTHSPVSVRADATVADAVELMTLRGFSAAPVIDERGRPIGVVSRSDVLVHDRECFTQSVAAGTNSEAKALTAQARVRDIMTPALFSVPPETTAAAVVEQLVELNVHHLFVVDRAGVVIGVIGTLDILRKLHRAD